MEEVRTEAQKADAAVPGVLEMLAAGGTLVSHLRDARPQYEVELSVRCMVGVCFNAAALSGWWTDLVTGKTLHGPIVPGEMHPTNIPAKLLLVISEVAEGFVGAMDDAMDDKLPHRKMMEVELADAVIRICDTAGALQLDIAPAFTKITANRMKWGDTVSMNLMLIVTDVVNAMESFRKGHRNDTEFPEFKGLTAHLCRAMVRLLALGHELGYDVPGAMAEKLVFNASRPDHKPENRAADGGKSI